MNGFDSVEEALEELRNGKIILVTDDPDRENEGDFTFIFNAFSISEGGVFCVFF